MTPAAITNRPMVRIAARAVLGLFLMLVCQAEVIDRVVAVVGDDVITERELDRAMKEDLLALSADEDALPGPSDTLSREEYLDRMIDRMVIEQEVRKQGISVDPLEIERAIDRKRESLDLTEDEFQRALSMQGITMDEYREQIRLQLVTFRLISREVREEIRIEDSEIENYYRQHRETFKSKDQYRLSHIYLPFPEDGDSADRARVAAELESIRSKIDDEADFAKMAKNRSRTPTASQGGDLGWFTIDELLPQFRSRARGLAEGGMSEVFVFGQGAHLIMLTEVKQGELVELAAVSDRVRQILYQRETMERYDIWLERLKSRTYVEKRLSPPI